MAMIIFFTLFSLIIVSFGILHRLLHRREQPKQILHPETSTDVSPTTNPSLTSRTLWKYDVFLSFRGPDVRQGFLSHLYKSLTDKGIHTFRDDPALKRGDFISDALLEAIEQSRFAIVVLSENYATSRWCLEELVHITDCLEKKRIELIPVFLGVDPSHVKKQSGKFAKAFAKHDERYGTKTVETWRNAMSKVGFISGWDSRNWNEESKLIEELVQDLSDRLFSPVSSSSSDSSELIGMSTHMRSIYPLMSMDSDDVRMIGIWGMGGIGKTTIAKYVYKLFLREFHGASLLENVKRDFKRHGPTHLREKILSEIFRKKDLNIWNRDSDVIKQRLCGKKILLVLDDVDDIQQLEELAGKPEWFGPGSRIIITTRDRSVLDYHDVKHIYEVKPLRITQALQLFSKHAFKKPRPSEDYRELSIDVVKLLGGLPLAIQVIGGSLYRRELEYWEDKLDLLRNNSDNTLLKALRVSYKALDERERKIFLYIALCFNGINMDRVRNVLDLFFPRHGAVRTRPSIIALMEKCMISLSKTNRLWVHDLLQDMAEDIVCEGKDEKPWKRLILWDFEDINHVFSYDLGYEAIEVESIFLDMSKGYDELNITPEIFRRIPNLKLLKFYANSSIVQSRTRMIDGLDYLPALRYLRWDAYNLKSLPSQFCMTSLVELNLSHSSIETVWNGSQDLSNLRILNLTSCKNLSEFPDLSKATNLETLKLSNCENLVEVPESSLRQLNKLVHLKLSNCKKLKSLPNNINLKSLKSLQLYGCSTLEEFPFISETLETLQLNETAIEQVPQSIDRLSRLKDLRLTGCTRLLNLPDSIKNLKHLTDLGLANCPNITSFPELGTNIQWLNLNRTGIETVPSTVGEKSELRYLNMNGCDKLVNLPPTLRKLAQLKYLYLRGCTNVTVSPELAGTKTMKALDLHGTSITDQLVDSKSEEPPQCEIPVIKRFFMKQVRDHIKKRKSNR